MFLMIVVNHASCILDELRDVPGVLLVQKCCHVVVEPKSSATDICIWVDSRMLEESHFQ